ncbi:MAG: hypothetical protein EAZ67_05965 [Cytophagales bacterium]|nr:MAG: hypothetical protein EAZ67_05965 [Cytophagales bacterium]
MNTILKTAQTCCLTLIFLTMLIFGAQAQDDKKDDKPSTLVKEVDHFDIYAMPMLNFYQSGDEFSYSLGSGLAMVLNRKYVFGLYNSGRSDTGNFSFSGSDYESSLRHGGLILGYSINANKVFHVNVNTLLGWGNVRISGLEDDAIVAVTPYAELEANVTRYFRVAVGGGYRIIGNANNTFYKPESFNAPTMNISFKFGWF